MLKASITACRIRLPAIRLKDIAPPQPTEVAVHPRKYPQQQHNREGRCYAHLVIAKSAVIDEVFADVGTEARAIFREYGLAQHDQSEQLNDNHPNVKSDNCRPLRNRHVAKSLPPSRSVDPHALVELKRYLHHSGKKQHDAESRLAPNNHRGHSS